MPADESPPETGHPYEETTEDSYADAATRFGIEQTRDGSIVLRGECPRCRHLMEYLISTAVTRSMAPLPVNTASGEDATEEMCCTCDAAHAGRPAGYLGCGAYWEIAVGVE